jgi:hypothetical protein
LSPCALATFSRHIVKRFPTCYIQKNRVLGKRMPWPLAISGVLLFSGADSGPRPGKAPWLEDLSAAQTEARRTGKPIFAALH